MASMFSPFGSDNLFAIIISIKFPCKMRVFRSHGAEWIALTKNLWNKLTNQGLSPRLYLLACWPKRAAAWCGRSPLATTFGGMRSGPVKEGSNAGSTGDRRKSARGECQNWTYIRCPSGCRRAYPACNRFLLQHQSTHFRTAGWLCLKSQYAGLSKQFQHRASWSKSTTGV